jgi:hypothetical protein
MSCFDATLTTKDKMPIQFKLAEISDFKTDDGDYQLVELFNASVHAPFDLADSLPGLDLARRYLETLRGAYPVVSRQLAAMAVVNAFFMAQGVPLQSIVPGNAPVAISLSNSTVAVTDDDHAINV